MRCSFCGKVKSEVARLIAGPSANICNECVVHCVGVLDDDGVSIRMGDGQLLVRFPDGTAHLCEQQGPWLPLAHDGVSLQWCAALAFTRTATPMPVAAVRSGKSPWRIVGSTFAREATITDAQARTVVDACGGAERLAAIDVPDASNSRANTAFGSPLPEGELTNALSLLHRTPTIDLHAFEIAPEVLRLVSRSFCARHVVLPVSRAGGSLVVAFVDPKDRSAFEAVKEATGLKIDPVIASESEILSAIARHFGD